MVLKRSIVMAALQNQTVKEVPASFWRHFALNEFTDAQVHSGTIEINLNGHKEYYQKVRVDFAKTMLDGYFSYPFHGVDNPRYLDDLKKLQPITLDDPWLIGQVELARHQRRLLGSQPMFVTIFSPLILLKWSLIEHYAEPLELADARFTDLYQQDPALVKEVLEIIAQDQIKVVQSLMNQTDIDGIYYSTQEIQDSRLNDIQFFNQVMEPIDQLVEVGINQVSPLNILHICGFAGATNHLEWYTDYPLQVVNWATTVDGYTLGEGKKLFHDKAVLGGLDNDFQGILYAGTKKEIQETVKRLINEAGKQGVLIGADCTVPRDISYEHLNWAIEAAHQA